MKLVILETPYAGRVALNIEFARACMADCLKRGEAPFASHLLYTQPGILDDTKSEERMLGISGGMNLGIEEAERDGRPVEYRKLFP